MQKRMILVAVIALCGLTVAVAAQGQPVTDSCDTSGGVTGACPPTGTNMGQSDYQRAPHPNAYEGPVTPRYVTTTPLTPDEATPEMATPASSGLGPLTPPEASRIAVDDKYVYVLQGDEVIKLDKNDLHVVARTKLAPSAP